MKQMARILVMVAGAALLVATPTAVMAQTAASAQTQARQLEQDLRARQGGPERVVVIPGGLDPQRADEVRRDLQQVMRRYPPALGRILKLDPTLMTNPTYLAPYPALVEYLKGHPEIPRYSGYFLNFVDESGNSWEPTDPDAQFREQVFRMWSNTLDGLTVFLVFLVVTGTIMWLVKFFIGHRRWLRTTKVQSEVHGRLLERFGSNDELMAYVQSPAGSKFLSAAPIDMTEETGISAPFSRILWSVQAGLVLACGGVGLVFVKRYVLEEVAQMMLVMGTVAITLGIGFVLAAVASYVLSNKLGLFNRTKP